MHIASTLTIFSVNTILASSALTLSLPASIHEFKTFRQLRTYASSISSSPLKTFRPYHNYDSDHRRLVSSIYQSSSPEEAHSTITPNGNSEGVDSTSNSSLGTNGLDAAPQVMKAKSDDLIDFEKDVTLVLKELRNKKDTTCLPASIDTKLLSISNIWDLSMWEMHTSRFRYVRHMATFFTSRLMKRIYPQLSVCVLWSIACVSILTNNCVAMNEYYVPLTPLSLVSTFIAFMLTLRSNQGLARLNEGRQLWGRTFIVTRDTAQLLASYVYPKDKELGLCAARHLAIFAWLLKGHLRNSDDSDIIQTMLPNKYDEAYVQSARKKPIAIIARIRQVVATLASRNALPIPAHDKLERNLNELNYICGMCERLRGSPIPPVYTSHMSRLLVFYLTFLPLALHGSQMKKVVTVIVTATMGFTMLGLDEISHLLEQPFRLMPMHQLSKNMMMDVSDAFVFRPPVFQSSGLMSKPDGIVEEEFCYPFDNEKNPAPSYW